MILEQVLKALDVIFRVLSIIAILITLAEKLKKKTPKATKTNHRRR